MHGDRRLRTRTENDWCVNDGTMKFEIIDWHFVYKTIYCMDIRFY